MHDVRSRFFPELARSERDCHALLTSLCSLGSNSIRNKGATALGLALHGNTALQSFRYKVCSAPSALIDSLASPFHRLWANDITAAGARALGVLCPRGATVYLDYFVAQAFAERRAADTQPELE
jgi:hypothetical protein